MAFPLALIPLIAAAAGGTMQGLSGLLAEEVMPTNINAQQTQQFTELLNSLLGTSRDNLSNQLTQATRTQEQISGVAAKQGQVTQKIGQLDTPDADDWFNNFTQKYVPAYQAIAQQTAEAASQLPSAQERADRASAQGVTAALDQFAGGSAYSGAAATAATEAAVNPQLEYLNQVDQAFGQNYAGTFNQLANQGQNLSFQSTQNEFLNNLQKLTSQLGGLGQQGQTLGTQLQGSLSQANIFSNQQNSLMQQLASLSEPVYSLPSYKESPLASIGQIFTGFGGAMGNFQNNQQMADILAALNK